MSRGPAPLLRSPPFPWVKAEVAAVSLPAGDDALAKGDVASALFAQIAAARVGGAFWAAPAPPPPPGAVLLVPSNAAQAQEMVDKLDDKSEPIQIVASASMKGLPDVPRIDARCDPWSLLRDDVTVHADANADLAALATIAGVPVRTFGTGRFGNPAAVAAHLMENTQYRDPFSGEPATLEAVLALLTDWRRLIDDNRSIAVLAGITPWKRRAMRQFFWVPRDRPLAFRSDPEAACAAAKVGGGTIVAWPSRIGPELPALAEQRGVPLAFVEDGFIRSAGLGSGLHPPQSIVLDRGGMHYDPAAASDLERLLESAPLTPKLVARGTALRRRLVAAGIGKYGGGAAMVLPARDPARRLLLVPGQVSDDLSVRTGGAGAGGNAELLARARALEPEAEIWYRPHPDVDAGHRPGGLSDADALAHADRIIRGGTVAQLLALVDGVHVLTSLTGFEALLRDLPVTVHGLPFYAGWGLTRDLAATPPRRTRRLTVDELAAVTLIRYPRYLDPVTQLPCPPEVLVERLGTRHRPRRTLLTGLRRWQGWLVRRLTARS